MHEQTETPDSSVPAMDPEVDAARVEMHRLVDEAFNPDSSTRVVMHAVDEVGIATHVGGLNAAEYAQVMEATYAQYQKRYYRNTPEVLQ